MMAFTAFRLRIILLLMTIVALLSSYVLQYGWHLHPCPLCLMQRLMVWFLLLTLACSFLGRHKKIWQKSVMALQVIWSIAGVYFSGRQIWLQHLPADQVPPACMPDVEVMIRYFPWQQTVKAMLLGDGDCARDAWSLLGLSLPQWTLAYFIIMLLASIVLFRRVR